MEPSTPKIATTPFQAKINFCFILLGLESLLLRRIEASVDSVKPPGPSYSSLREKGFEDKTTLTPERRKETKEKKIPLFPSKATVEASFG